MMAPRMLPLLGLAACATNPASVSTAEYYGTLEPFASEAVYFVITDRFVDGDASNNHPEQGGPVLGTFDRPLQIEGRPPANIGYLGGDFKGIVNNAHYISELGFTALWLTPIVENPDEAFTGGTKPGDGILTDLGKTGYHGYWGVNFFEVDEHWPSDDLRFEDVTRKLRQAGIKTVLDVVCNHGSPAYTMPKDQPLFGELYDAQGRLIADHQNLHPSKLDPNNPLHAFFRRTPDLAQLADVDFDNPAVLDYFVSAHLKWIDQGVDALRIDTIKHMPLRFWKAFSDRIRARHPKIFMFAEAFSFEAIEIAPYTRPKNGAISVLDFPGQKAMNSVFARGGGYERVEAYLHLTSGVYENPYELMIFYDNHDLPRMDATTEGFIDAHNWLFTSRGIPVVYYGSEVRFRAGASEHGGNRDYFGQTNVDTAKSHAIHAGLKQIANVRKRSVALQRGLQQNLLLRGDHAVFRRVYQKDGVAESALVLLNKSDEAATLTATQWLGKAEWTDAMTGVKVRGPSEVSVPGHGVRVLLNADPIDDASLKRELAILMRAVTASQSDARP